MESLESKLRLLERRKIDGDKVLEIVKSEANESSQSPLIGFIGFGGVTVNRTLIQVAV